jgi:peptidylprolyl isomerase
MLVFDVELLKVLPSKIDAPADVAAPPKDSTKTASGLAYKVVKPGPGTGDHPAATSIVEVDYSGWTTDGKMFDSSLTRGLEHVVPARQGDRWVDRRRPAHEGRATPTGSGFPKSSRTRASPGKPQGMLVFDVTLLSIKEK